MGGIKLFETTFVAAVTWLVWRVLSARRRSPLRHIDGPPANSWLEGHIPDFLVNESDSWESAIEVACARYGGIFKGSLYFKIPFLYVSDPKALHHVFVKDMQVFEKMEDSVMVSKMSFGPGLLSMQGAQHKKQRKLLNPMFNMAHLRGITPTFYDVAYRMRVTIGKHISYGHSAEIEMLPWATRAALELVGQGILGHSFESLEEANSMGTYTTTLKNLVPTWSSFTVSRRFVLPLVQNIGTPEFRRRAIGFIPWKKLHLFRDMCDLLYNTSLEIYRAKKNAYLEGQHENASQGSGKEILALILKANAAASDEDRLTEEEIIAQISTFTFAGMDTTSNALCRVLHLLSEDPEKQDTLRREIVGSRKHAGDLNYDDLMALPYLDGVVRETLRLYPPAPHLVRVPRENTVLPVSKPIRTTKGEFISEVVVPKGTVVVCSVFQSNQNPDIWGEDAKEWKPERWASPLPESVNEAKISGVYSNLMTFSAGGRACIGFKFAELELKVMLSILVEAFSFSLPKDSKVVWELHGSAHPVVQRRPDGTPVLGTKFGLPLIVSLASSG
ncbi:cytochrome P450 [Coprinellus micaceus]|uniref:Cytochrome P450 n=1 Tax=Coprinellus micaceus TaxID=71717 RepID=A0A4Y7TLW0_COPMI|nr:cytochrome P450 [Coprinellus micaceus]